jgi:hypothetical protein
MDENHCRCGSRHHAWPQEELRDIAIGRRNHGSLLKVSQALTALLSVTGLQQGPTSDGWQLWQFLRTYVLREVRMS